MKLQEPAALKLYSIRAKIFDFLFLFAFSQSFVFASEPLFFESNLAPAPKISLQVTRPELNSNLPLGAKAGLGYALHVDSAFPNELQAKIALIGTFRKGFLVSKDLNSSKEFWSYRLPAEPVADVKIHKDQVYLALANNQVLAFQTKSGELTQKFSVKMAYGSSLSFKDRLLIVRNEKEQLSLFDLGKSEKRWFYNPDLSSEITLSEQADPYVIGNELIYGLSNGEIHFVDLSSGSRTKTVQISYSSNLFKSFVGQFFVQNAELYFARADGYFGSVALGSRIGLDLKPSFLKNLGPLSTMTFRDSKVYLGATNGDIYVSSLGSQNTESVDKNRTQKISLVGAAVEIYPSENNLFVVTAGGAVYRYDMQENKLHWQDHLETQVISPILYFPKGFLIQSGLGNLYSYRFSN